MFIARQTISNKPKVSEVSIIEEDIDSKQIVTDLWAIGFNKNNLSLNLPANYRWTEIQKSLDKHNTRNLFAWGDTYDEAQTALSYAVNGIVAPKTDYFNKIQADLSKIVGECRVGSIREGQHSYSAVFVNNASENKVTLDNKYYWVAQVPEFGEPVDIYNFSEHQAVETMHSLENEPDLKSIFANGVFKRYDVLRCSKNNEIVELAEYYDALRIAKGLKELDTQRAQTGIGSQEEFLKEFSSVLNSPIQKQAFRDAGLKDM